MTSVRASGLFEGTVTHTRRFPRRHHLSYRVWYLLLDLAELDELDAAVPGFGVERAAAVSFRAQDHGARDGSPLRPWIDGQLSAAGIELAGGAVRLLCFPRVLGYTFNPLSVWFCHNADGTLRAILYEVSNTFGEHHSYLVPVEPGARPGETVGRRFDKELFVSPFIDMDATYDFRTRVPDDRLAIVVREHVRDGRVLDVALTARRLPLDGRHLASVFVRFPLVTLKVIGGIHWEALKLWRKGAPYRRRGTPPAHPVTIVPSPARGEAGAARAAVVAPREVRVA
jgi:DUF1365 family protein